jgi:hypothetical protein
LATPVSSSMVMKTMPLAVDGRWRTSTSPATVRMRPAGVRGASRSQEQGPMRALAKRARMHAMGWRLSDTPVASRSRAMPESSSIAGSAGSMSIGGSLGGSLGESLGGSTGGSAKESETGSGTAAVGGGSSADTWSAALSHSPPWEACPSRVFDRGTISRVAFSQRGRSLGLSRKARICQVACWRSRPID